MFYEAPNWRHCRKCQGLYFAGYPSQGVCPADRAEHDGTQSEAFVLYWSHEPLSPWAGQGGWQWCNKCFALFYGGLVDRSRCPADAGRHAVQPTGVYAVEYTDDHTPLWSAHLRAGWRWCSSCQGLVFERGATAGVCPATGGPHTNAGYHYVVRVAGPVHVGSTFRLLVIAPEVFRSRLQPLVDHKNATGLSSRLVSVAELVDYYDGRDHPERIKQGLAYAWEFSELRYVFLVGDASLVPTRQRYTQLLPSDPNWRDGWYSSTDFYYANLHRNHEYRPDGTVAHGAFSDWDLNGDHRYNAHNWNEDAVSWNPDDVDAYCDLAVGRLAAHEAAEVERYVNKVIAYEMGRASAACRGMTTIIEAGYPAGPPLAAEVIARVPVTDPLWPESRLLAANYYPSDPRPANSRLLGPHGLQRAAEESAWISYVGHGWPDGWNFDEANGGAVAGFGNAQNLPVVYAAGCSTGQIMSHGPDGPGAYRDVYGQMHRYVVTGNERRPDRIDDFGAVDPATPGAMPIRTWTVQNGVPPRITAEEPDTYSPANERALTVSTDWLFGPGGGGAIAYIGEITVAPNNSGCDLLTRILTHRPPSGPVILGDMWVAGARDYRRDFGTSEDRIASPRLYLSYMMLYGDPSLRLRLAPTVATPNELPRPPWQADPGLIVSSPVLNMSADGRLELTGVGTNAKVWHKWQSTPNGGWVDWVPFVGSPDCAGRPAAVRNADGRMEVFVTGLDGKLYHGSQTDPSAGWSGWESLGESVASAPAAVLDQDGRVQVFVRQTGEDGRMLRRMQSNEGEWNLSETWEDLGVPPSKAVGNPAAALTTDGRVAVFIRNGSGTVHFIWQTTAGGTFSAWATLSRGILSSDPVVGRMQDGRLAVFGRGVPDGLWWIEQVGASSWSGWTGLGGSLLVMNDVAVASSPAYGLCVCATGSRGEILVARQTGPGGAWSPLESLGGAFVGGLCAGVHENGRVQVVAQSTALALGHRWETTPGGAWNQ